MKDLTLDDLHDLRIAVLANALSLQKEAMLLFEHKFFARAFLLAHFVTEELGKLTVIIGAVSDVQKGRVVHPKGFGKRFLSHAAKIAADNTHHMLFGLPRDLPADKRFDWLKTARASVRDRVAQKNTATYVDLTTSGVESPLEIITQDIAEEMIKRAGESLDAHWLSESMLNPILREALLERERDVTRLSQDE